MWKVFKRSPPSPTRAELVASIPQPPCDNREVHYEWTVENHTGCPLCALIRRAKIEAEREDHMAELIASKIVQKLIEKGIK